MAHMQRVVLLTLVGKVSFLGRQGLSADVYPMLKGCSQFFQDFLVKDPTTGYMVVCPSNSPENHPGLGSYTTDEGKTMNCSLFGGVAMDNQMVYDVLKNTAEAARILGKDLDFATELDLLKARITPYKVGKYGQVQEWQEDWDRESTSHRHISHLLGRISRQPGIALRQPHHLSGRTKVAHRPR